MIKDQSQTHLLYGSRHGGHGSSVGAGAAHGGQELWHWDGHLGAPLLQETRKKDKSKAERQERGGSARRVSTVFKSLPGAV